MQQTLTRFLSLAFASADVLLEVDVDGLIAFAVGAASSLLHRGEADLPGMAWTDLFDAGDRPLVVRLAGQLAVGRRAGPVLVRLATGNPDKAHFATISLFRQPDNGRLSCGLSAVPPAIAEEAASRRYEAQSQLLDQGSFGTAVEQLGRMAATLRQPMTLSLLEMPGLAARADATADELVASIGAILRSASVDGAAAGRLGDERFSLVHQPDGARLGDAIAAMVAEGQHAGVALTVQRQSLSLDEPALDEEKRLKAVRFVINRFVAQGASADAPKNLAQAFDAMVSDTLQQINALSATMRDDAFGLMYQPIVSIAEGRLHHFEVLARFEPDRSPFEKIQFAEQVGLIESFDLLVCRRAARVIQAAPRPVALAVNVSGRSLSSGLFVDALLALLAANTDIASSLLLEVTESAELDDLARAERIIQAIRRQGFAVCLDDFGAGAASFRYLQALTVDHVKLDGAYVGRIGQSRRDDALLKSMIGLCHDLGVETIAEMVETAEQEKALSHLGVTYGQGWYYGKPTPLPIWSPKTAAARRRGETVDWR